jgi:hypothetical protein
MDGITVPTVDAVTGITNFETEVVNTTEIFDGIDPDGTMPFVDDYQDIKRFFERPRMISNIVALTSRGALYNRNYLTGGSGDPILSHWPTAAVNRLNGILGYRCKVKYTLTASATPFQQGVLVMAWQYATNTGANASVCRTQFVQAATNVHHTRLDYSDSTMAELIIPFTSQRNFFDIANNVAGGGDNNVVNYGTFSITQFLPYQTLTTSNPPTFKLYISLHDMELFGAVPVSLGAVIPQGGLTHSMNKESKRYQNKTPSPKLPTVVGIPKLSDVTTAVSWAAAKATDLAKAFGYAKPVDERDVERRFVSGYTHDGHVDQPSEAFVVSPFQSNRIAVDGPHYPNDLDEMSFTYMLSQFNQCFLGNMTTSDNAGTVLYATNVCPTSFWFRSNTGRPGGNIGLPIAASATTNSFWPTGICYISQMFRRWRGGIKLRITFGKTKFHAGRVLLSFVPATYDTITEAVLSNPVPTPENAGGLVQPFQSSTIFDLKDSNVVEFNIPFVSSRPWISTLGSVGGFTITVLDPLITSGETSTSIFYVVEVAASDDYQLGDLIGSGLQPANSVNPPNNLVLLQSGLDAPLEDVTPYTMGECFNSSKQIIQIPSWQNFSVLSGSGIYLPLWALQPTNNTTPNPLPITTSLPFSLSNGSVIAAMFSFVSGATEYDIYCDAVTGITLTQGTYAGNGNLITTFSDPRRRNNYNKSRVVLGPLDSAQHFKFPSFQTAPLVPVWSMQVNGGIGGGYNFGQWAFDNQADIPLLEAFTSPSGVLLGVRASDDARCHVYIGPPPCFLYQSTQSVEIDALSSAFVSAPT